MFLVQLSIEMKKNNLLLTIDNLKEFVQFILVVHINYKKNMLVEKAFSTFTRLHKCIFRCSFYSLSKMIILSHHILKANENMLNNLICRFLFITAAVFIE